MRNGTGPAVGTAGQSRMVGASTVSFGWADCCISLLGCQRAKKVASRSAAAAAASFGSHPGSNCYCRCDLSYSCHLCHCFVCRSRGVYRRILASCCHIGTSGEMDCLACFHVRIDWKASFLTATVAVSAASYHLATLRMGTPGSL